MMFPWSFSVVWTWQWTVNDLQPVAVRQRMNLLVSEDADVEIIGLDEHKEQTNGLERR